MSGVVDYSCLLKFTNNNALKKFLHHCIDELTGKIVQEIHNNCVDDIELSPDEHRKAKDLIQNLYRENIFEEEFALSLVDLSNSQLEEIKNCFNIRKQDIYNAIVREQLLKHEIPLIENIDWKLKWVMGSSKLASLSDPLLQVELNYLQENKFNHKNDSVQFEVNFNQLNNLIEILEQVKSQLN